jgi:hypothetical protein
LVGGKIMCWIQIENRRINLEFIATYGVTDEGDTFVQWCHGGSTRFQGGEVAKQLDSAIGVPKVKPPMRQWAGSTVREFEQKQNPPLEAA